MQFHIVAFIFEIEESEELNVVAFIFESAWKMFSLRICMWVESAYYRKL